jgi:hypothetical protein
MYPVKRICAWCKAELGLAEFYSTEPGKVTHGICDSCLEKEMEKIKKLRK